MDLGYGFDARTTLESAARFRRINPDLPILGVEIDKERVEAAVPYADRKTFFRLGGFNLPLTEGEHVRMIRAFNVLRQYEEKDFVPACEQLAGYVLPGELIYNFFEAWKASAAETAAMKAYSLRQWFVHTAEALSRKGYGINLQKKFLSRGYLVWEK